MANVSDYLENAYLNALRNVAVQVAAVWVQLHTADPTDTGTSAVALNTTRKQVTFAAASGGSMSSNADVEWTNVPNSETYHSISLWDAETNGNCLWRGALTTQRTVTAGDTFRIPSGSLTLTMA